MHPDNLAKLEHRVTQAAGAALAASRFVTAIDVLERVGWLAPAHIDAWRQGRLPYLERAVQVNLSKLSTAMRLFHRWAREQGLKPSDATYVARTRDRRPLRFSKSGNAAIERAYRTHWISPDLSEAKRQRLIERQSKPPDLVVVSPLHDWVCISCGGTGDLLLMQDDGPLCMKCAKLDRLVFLPSGDTGRTRRAKKASSTYAVVIRFSRSRERYERQGLLVEPHAIDEPEDR
jgi:hypothetical protein